MQDHEKTKDQLIDELTEMRRKVADLETAQAKALDAENAPLSYQSLDENGYFLAVNHAWLSTLGYSREEVIGKSFSDFLAPGYQDVFKINFPKFKAAGEIHGVEFEMVRKDGSIIPVAFEGKIARDQLGCFKLTHCILQDITRRKRAEEALAESEQKFRLMFENSLDGILLTAPDGRIFDANESACQMWGRTREEICELGREGVVETTDSRLAIAVEQRGREGRWKGKLNLQRGDGTIFPVEISTNIYKDGRGDDRTVMVIRDITDIEIAIEAQRKSEEKFRLIFEAAPLGIIHFDTNGVVTDCNQVFVEIIGSSMEQTIGFNLLTSLRSEEVRKAVESALSGKIGRFEGEYTSVIGGKQVWIKLLYSPISDTEGLVTGGLGIFEDITERRRAAEALRESEEKYRNVFNNAGVGMFRTRLDGSEIIDFNDKYLKMLNRTREEVIGKPSVIHWVDPHEREEMVRMINAEGQVNNLEIRLLTAQGEERTFMTSVRLYPEQEILEGSIIDITERKRLEQEKEDLIVELQKALSEVKKLSGFLPICSWCKKIRDDEGYWSEIERYIGEHSETQFSHGICPDCTRKLYPEIADEVLSQLEKDKKK